MLRVLTSLMDEGYPIQLTIVSTLESDYVTHATEKDKLEVQQMVSEHTQSIIWYPSLPNKEVIELMKGSDVALLPTMRDTYGYSVLEAQACGCPVITTDIRALPEINSDDTGWVIPVNHIGKATSKNCHLFSREITDGLESIVPEIINNPEQIMRKGNASIQRIREHHGPVKIAQRLKAIYDQF